jgi:hypothetical protein
MSFYSELIIKATGCQESDAEEIEDYMRDIIFHSTLDWQTRKQLEEAAKEAYSDILFMRSPEGQEYIKQIEEEMLKSY